jgi:hypothetical protein
MRTFEIIAIVFLMFGGGCSKKSASTDTGKWSLPQEVAKSSDSLATSFSLHKWNGMLLTYGGEAGTGLAPIWWTGCECMRPGYF